MSRIPEGWTEVKAPTLVKFEKVGTAVRGTLLELKMQPMRDEHGETKNVLLARLELENGEQIEMMPSFDLRRKIGKRHLNKELYIVYESDDDSTAAKGNAMKIFRVFVNPNAGAEEPFYATDADLPPL